MGLTEEIFFPKSVVDETAKRFVILGEFGLIAPFENEKNKGIKYLLYKEAI